MITYLVLMMCCLVTSYFAIRFYRFVLRLRLAGVKVVSLSSGRSQMQYSYQRGFVSANGDDRVQRLNGQAIRRKRPAGKASIRKPWGW